MVETEAVLVESAAPVRLLLLSVSLLHVGESCGTFCNLCMMTRLLLRFYFYPPNINAETELPEII